MKNKTAEEILDKYYSPKMHWKSVNRQNVLKAMEEFAKKYSDSKLSELEKWIDENKLVTNELDDTIDFLDLKAKIQSLK